MGETTRIAWRAAYASLVKWWLQNQWFPPAVKAREFFVCRICAETGAHIVIDRNPTFSSTIHMGDCVRIGRDGELHGGDRLGDHVLMAQEVIVCIVDHEHGSLDMSIDLQGDTEMRLIYVDNDVWLGRCVMVMPGVHIGDGCIDAAGAGVVKNVPSFSIVGGGAGRGHRIAA